MPRLIWSPGARRDLARLQSFLAASNPEAARRAMETIHQGVKLLKHYPEAGRLIDETPAEFRRWVISFGAGGYVVVYRLN